MTLIVCLMAAMLHSLAAGPLGPASPGPQPASIGALQAQSAAQDAATPTGQTQPQPTAAQAAAAPSPDAATARAPAASPEAEIRELLKRQTNDWNRGNVTAFMSGYWKSPNTEFVGPSGIVRGWQLVLNRYRKAYPDRAAMGHLDFSSLEVTMLGPEAALVTGHWRLKLGGGDRGGVFTLVFRKFPEGWRIINDHTSESAP